MLKDSTMRFGIILNVMASICFAAMFAYTTRLDALSGEELYGWRMLLTFPFLTLLIWYRREGTLIMTIYQRGQQARLGFWLTRGISASLLSVQLWLFVWAPSHGYSLPVSLGYFMMPITMVIIGRFAFKERMSRLQQIAALLALLGVINQFSIAQTLAWPTWVVGLGYPLYFWLRRQTDTHHIGGLWFDMLLSVPISLFLIIQHGGVINTLDTSTQPLWGVLGLGLLSALALACQALSAPHLNLSLFGLLVYVEPVLLLVVALLLGETIPRAEWPTYMAIWLAVCVLILEGVLSLKQPPRFNT